VTTPALDIVPDCLGLEGTVDSILAVQRSDGLIPWVEGGRADPWNHVEATMALAVAGERAAAERAFWWLESNQGADGSWPAAYGSDGSVLERHVDTNAVAYVATGVNHFLLSTSDLDFVSGYFSVVEAALDFVCRVQRHDGMIPWSIGDDGRCATDSLLAASASIFQSFSSGVVLARALGVRRPAWSSAAEKLARCISVHEADFADKSVFAMDWYYPVLAGVIDAVAARQRLDERADDFILFGEGVRCRSDGRWVTAAETAECAIAYARAGSKTTARRLLSWADALRDDGGAYLTGLVHPERSEFPPGERSTYSAAAVVLANDVCSGGPTASLFFPLR